MSASQPEVWQEGRKCINLPSLELRAPLPAGGTLPLAVQWCSGEVGKATGDELHVEACTRHTRLLLRLFDFIESTVNPRRCFSDGSHGNAASPWQCDPSAIKTRGRAAAARMNAKGNKVFPPLLGLPDVTLTAGACRSCLLGALNDESSRTRVT